jgi:hypothetical protein
MRFIRIGDGYAINADRILDVTYTAMSYEEKGSGEWDKRIPATISIRIAEATEIEERTLEGQAAENFWSALTGSSVQ